MINHTMEIKEKDLIIIGMEEFIVEAVEENGYWVSNDNKETWVSPDQIDAHFPKNERITDEY